MDTFVEAITTLFQVANTLSPLAVIALLVIVVIMLLQAKNKNLLDMPAQLDTLSNNHLSGLPDMEDSLKRIETLLQSINDNIIYVRARINGGSK